MNKKTREAILKEVPRIEEHIKYLYEKGYCHGVYLVRKSYREMGENDPINFETPKYMVGWKSLSPSCAALVINEARKAHIEYDPGCDCKKIGELFLDYMAPSDLGYLGKWK